MKSIYDCVTEAQADELRRLFVNKFYMLSDSALKDILEIAGIKPATSREDKIKQIGGRLGISWPEKQ